MGGTGDDDEVYPEGCVPEDELTTSGACDEVDVLVRGRGGVANGV